MRQKCRLTDPEDTVPPPGRAPMHLRARLKNWWPTFHRIRSSINPHAGALLMIWFGHIVVIWKKE